MIVVAWDHLSRHGQLSQKQLVNDLNVKRSAFICALLSRLPGVEYDAVPHVRLRFLATDGGGPEALNEARMRAKDSEAQQLSRHRDEVTHRPDEEWVGADEYADRLNGLFDTAMRDGRGEFSNEEVADALQLDGIPVHANSISRLRSGLGGPPTETISYALAYFFGVDPGHLIDEIDFSVESSRPSRAPTSRAPLSPSASKVPHESTVPTPDAVPVTSDVRLSPADLLRISGGLSRAAEYEVRRPYADRGLIRRLIMLVSDLGPMLTESLIGDVRVPIRYLEHVIVEWDATSPADNGTEPDFRWLAELLNRHLDK